ncbi:hypothetical protein [Subtercola endophyticus]|uniref:hypothetical protein n=1 Tax=Subtercola endophyticus TaxID=2895559 RepID=UPI001E6183AC|nr:hypothetical protein [Subtercola endophyticus]UFS58699.1 hypothetical protein LQ955_17140 [Subtercola endophyticus]
MARVLIPGRSAGALAVTQNTLACMTLTLYAALIFAFILDAQNYKPLGLIVVFFFLISGALCGFATLILSVVVSYRASNEISYGYTTLPRRNRHVEQLDPATGRTISAAGEPFLDSATSRQRIASGFDLSADGRAPIIPAYTSTRRSWCSMWRP